MELRLERIAPAAHHYQVYDECRKAYVTRILPERDARIFAQAQRALELLEDLLAWNDPENNQRVQALPASLYDRAVEIVGAARVRGVHIIGGNGDET